MPFELGPFLIVGIVVLLQLVSLSKVFHPIVRLIFLWIATWNTHIRLQPSLITPAGYEVPNLDYPSRNLWKFLGMLSAFLMVYLAVTAYAPTLSPLDFLPKLMQGSLCILAIFGGVGYMLHFYNLP